jgi:3D (Asp-Asp-Asp) domain-containing protein
MKTVLIPIIIVSALATAGVAAMPEVSYTISYQAETPTSEVGIRTVSAYTLGRVEETDSTPCIGAYGNDLCEMVRKGVDTCASNEFPKGTKLIIGDGVECIVMDRMNSRYKTEIDLAMMDYQAARMFGRNSLNVKIK